MIDSVLAIMFRASRRALLQHFLLHMCDLMRCVAYADRAILPSDEAVPLKVTIVPPKLYLPGRFLKATYLATYVYTLNTPDSTMQFFRRRTVEVKPSLSHSCASDMHMHARSQTAPHTRRNTDRV